MHLVGCLYYCIGDACSNKHQTPFPFFNQCPPSVPKRLVFKLSPVSNLFINLPPYASASDTVQHRLLLTWSWWLASHLDRLYLRTKILDSRRLKCCKIPKLLWVQRKLWKAAFMVTAGLSTYERQKNKHDGARHRENVGLICHLVTLHLFVPWIDRLCFHGNHSKILLPCISTSLGSLLPLRYYIRDSLTTCPSDFSTASVQKLGHEIDDLGVRIRAQNLFILVSISPDWLCGSFSLLFNGCQGLSGG